MSEFLCGTTVKNGLVDDLINQCAVLKERGLKPMLGLIRVGQNKAILPMNAASAD